MTKEKTFLITNEYKGTLTYQVWAKNKTDALKKLQFHLNPNRTRAKYATDITILKHTTKNRNIYLIRSK